MDNRREWCKRCQMGQTLTENQTCPRCGLPLPNEPTSSKPEKEMVSRGGYTKDTSYETKTEWKPKRKMSKETKEKISKSLRKRKAKDVSE